MKITESVSFWTIIFSLAFGIFIGNVTGYWLFGVITFFFIAGKGAIFSIIMDTITWGLHYHHDREDERAKKSFESLKYLKEHSPNSIRVLKILNIRR